MGGGPRWGFAGCGIRPFLVAGYGIGSKIVAGFGIQISAGCGICHKIIAGFGIQISRGNFHLNVREIGIAELTQKFKEKAPPDIQRQLRFLRPFISIKEMTPQNVKIRLRFTTSKPVLSNLSFIRPFEFTNQSDKQIFARTTY